MLASLVLSFVTAIVPDDAAKSELGAALKKLEGAQSYRCDYAVAAGKAGGPADQPAGGEVDKPADGAGKGGGAKSGRDAWSIDFQRGKPVHLKSGNFELYREDKKMVLHDAKSGKWAPLDPAAGPAAGGAGAGKGAAAGGGADDPEAKSRMMAQRMAAELEKLVLPHALARDLGGKFTDVSKSEAGGQSTYVAKLNKDVARELSGMKEQRAPAREGREGRPGRDGDGGGQRERPKRGGGGGGDGEGDGAEEAFAAHQDAPPERGGKAAAGGRGEAEVSGIATVVVAGGVVKSIGIEISIQGPQARVVRKSWQLAGVDATTVEVPADAATALAGK